MSKRIELSMEDLGLDGSTSPPPRGAPLPAVASPGGLPAAAPAPGGLAPRPAVPGPHTTALTPAPIPPPLPAHPIHAAAPAYAPALPAPLPAIDPTARTPRRRWVRIATGMGVTAVVAAGAGGAFFALHGHGDETAAFQRSVDDTVRPVDDANGSLTIALQTLSGADTGGARQRTVDAQGAVAAAGRRLGTLKAPEDAAGVVPARRRALAAESAYLAAVAATLADSRSDDDGRLPTLADTASGAFDGISPAAEDWGSSIGGAAQLQDWAQQRVRMVHDRAVRRANAERLRQERQSALSGEGDGSDVYDGE